MENAILKALTAEMKTLYIHGLDSSPKPDKMAVIREHSPAEGLHLDYRADGNAFYKLDEYINKHSITHIVGSSMGGFLGFWLAEKHQLPCLLFNPAVAERSVSMEYQQQLNGCPRRLVVLGAKDDVVNPQQTAEFLTDLDTTATYQRVVWCNNLAHQIDINTFTEFVDYFFDQQKNQ